MADDYTIKCVDKIIIELTNIPFQIKCVFVDGDSNYNYDIFETNQYFDFLNDCNKNKGFIISDFLHLLKNARTRLLQTNVVMNPFSIENYISYDALISDETISHFITDTNSLAKLRDELATNLFCLSTTFALFEKHSSSTFIYFLVYSLWTEALLNPNYSNKTRFNFLHIFKIKSIYMFMNM